MIVAEGNVLEQLRKARDAYHARRGRYPARVSVAPAIAAEIYREVSALRMRPEELDVEVRVIYGMAIDVDQDRVPRGLSFLPVDAVPTAPWAA